MRFTVAQITTDQLKVVGVKGHNIVILEKFLDGAINFFTGESVKRTFRIELYVPDQNTFVDLSNSLGKQIEATMQFNEGSENERYLIGFRDV